tara:strand:- start:1077 stop:1256 length:180 start_codon:yes stop_codon:yes gene_type:complete
MTHQTRVRKNKDGSLTVFVPASQSDYFSCLLDEGALAMSESDQSGVFPKWNDFLYEEKK